jgi:cytochrome c biogenesis protein CcmG/thiol:disulfide interchange protein DsbE
MSTAKPANRGRTVILAVVALAVVAAIGAIAFLSVEEQASVKRLEDIAGPVVLTGDPLPPFAGGDAPDPLEGQGVAAPAATALTMAGAEVAIGAGAGRGQVLVFLAHWCPVCQQEVPTLAQVARSVGVPDGVELVAIMTGLDPGRPNWPPDAWLEREGLGATATIVRDDVQGTLLRAYGLNAYPAWAVVGPDGTLLGRRTGLIDAGGIVALMAAAQG